MPTKREEILVDREKLYALTRNHGGQLFLEVVVGGFAMENLVIPLTAEECQGYEKAGKEALDELAYRICKETETFRLRASDG